MKLIKNNYHKKLISEVFGKPIGIEPGEIKLVEDNEAKVLLRNHWIKEVKPIEKIEKPIEKIVSYKRSIKLKKYKTRK